MPLPWVSAVPSPSGWIVAGNLWNCKYLALANRRSAGRRPSEWEDCTVRLNRYDGKGFGKTVDRVRKMASPELQGLETLVLNRSQAAPALLGGVQLLSRLATTF